MKPIFCHMMRNVFVVFASFCMFYSTANACTERTMLDFIGSLEAPAGYDQVYYGVKHAPPRPITSMTVQEVLDWQKIASRTAVSSAAGRYQVIRSNLKSVVNKGVVSPSDRYNSATQDKIGLHLLRGAGYRDGVSSPNVANRVAGIWAALPKVSGPGAGGSVYEGYAGNHALVDTGTYLGVMNCTVALADAQLKSGIIRAGTRFGFEFNRIIEIIAEQTEEILKATSKYAIMLLFFLATIDLVLHFGRAAIEGNSLEDITEAFMFKALAITFFFVAISYTGDIVKFMGDYGVETAEEVVGKTGFSLAGFAREKTVLIFSFLEGLSAKEFPIQVATLVSALIVIITTGLSMGLIVYVYAKLFIIAASAAILLGFGGLVSLRGNARKYLFHLLGTALHISALTLILHIGLSFSQTVRGEFDAVLSAMIVMAVEIIVLFLAYFVPKNVAALARG